MENWISFDLEMHQWLLLGLAAFFVGISKTGLPGVGILVVPVAANSLPARQSVGVVLPMLIVADLFGAFYYRRHAQWRHLVRLLPPALAGILAGWQTLRFIQNEQLRPLIGLIVLIMLALKAWMMTRKEPAVPLCIKTGPGKVFAFFMGFLAGLTTMMANAAGPVMVLYLLAMRLEKTHFVATATCFFFIVNWIKAPLMGSLGLINDQTLRLDLVLLPLVILGALAGIKLLPWIPQALFNTLALIFAAIAAVTLFF